MLEICLKHQETTCDGRGSTYLVHFTFQSKPSSVNY